MSNPLAERVRRLSETLSLIVEESDRSQKRDQMLTPEEEQRLEAFLEVSDRALAKDVSYDPKHYVEAVRWLATKVLEINKELKRVTNERNVLQQQYVQGP